MNEAELLKWQEESIAQAYERFEGETLAQCAECVGEGWRTGV